MMHVLLLSSVLSGILAAVLGPMYAWHRSKGFERQLGEATQAVKAVATKPQEKRASLASLTKGLPPPLRRFFQRCIRDERQFSLWTARTVGELRFDAKSKWKSIDAITVGAVAEPAFAYTGTLQLGPGSLLWCRGQEGYVEGKGRMEWRLWGAVRLTKQEGPRLDQNALVRYLAEAMCFPAALLPSQHLKWVASPTDPDHCASAVLSYGGAVVAATFTFDDRGLVREMRSNDFYRQLAPGRVVRTPWFARGSGHMRFGLGGGGIEVPTNLQAGWVEPDGSEFVYGRFTLARVQAEY